MLPWLLCALLGVLILVLLGKVRALTRAMEEICDQLADRLAGDTNNLLTLSTRDPHARRLAARLNVQLRLLRQQRRRYLNGDRELKEAVTNLSHDLRTPLTALCGYLDLLDRQKTSPAVARYLEQIRSRAEAMKALTEELFRYSLLAARESWDWEDVTLNQVLEESLLAHYGALTQRGITPQLDLTEVPVHRRLDRKAVSRVLANLLSNALKYSAGDLRVALTPAGEITFSNTAPGFTPVMVGRLFDRFYTVETGRTATGLGLAIAKLLTEAMGGTIQADYRGETLTLTLRFPPAEEKAVPRAVSGGGGVE